MANFLDKNGLTYLFGKLKALFISTVKVNNTALTPSSGAVNITVPTQTSQLTNNSNFVVDASYVHTDNNYTTTEKNKLSGIASGAQVNVIETVKVNGTALTPTDKTVNIITSASDVAWDDVTDKPFDEDEVVPLYTVLRSYSGVTDANGKLQETPDTYVPMKTLYDQIYSNTEYMVRVNDMSEVITPTKSSSSGTYTCTFASTQGWQIYIYYSTRSDNGYWYVSGLSANLQTEFSVSSIDETTQKSKLAPSYLDIDALKTALGLDGLEQALEDLL